MFLPLQKITCYPNLVTLIVPVITIEALRKLKVLRHIKTLRIEALDMNTFAELLSLPVFLNITTLSIYNSTYNFYDESDMKHIPAVISHCFPCLELLRFGDSGLRKASDFSNLPVSCYIVKTRSHLFEHFLNCRQIRCLILHSYCHTNDQTQDFGRKLTGAENLQISVLKIDFARVCGKFADMQLIIDVITSWTHLEALIIEPDLKWWLPRESSFEND